MPTRYDRCLEIARSYGRDLLNPALQDDATEVVGEIAAQYLMERGENDMYTTGCNFEAALPDAWEAFGQAQTEQEKRRQAEIDDDAAWALRNTPDAPCPGEGRRWHSGDGRPICPVCHRSPKGLGVPTPRKIRSGGHGWTGTVPAHLLRKN